MKFFSKKKAKEDFDLIDFEIEGTKNSDLPKASSPDALTPEDVLGIGTASSMPAGHNGALDMLKSKMAKQAQKGSEDDSEAKKESLLKKCKPYVIEEDGEDASIDKAPLYKLQSVAEILKNNSSGTIEKLSHSYDVSFDDITVGDAKPKAPKKSVTAPKTAPKVKFTEAQSNIHVISDIDPTPLDTVADAPSDDATVTFTPVGKTNKPTIKVSRHTKSIDLTNELIKLPEQAVEETESEHLLEKNEFEEFIPKYEVKTQKDAAKLKRIFSIKKRNAFLKMFFSFILTALLLLTKLPFMSGVILSSTLPTMIVCGVIMAIIIILNCDMFLSFSKIFTKKSTPDVCAALASVFTAVYAAVGIARSEIINDLLIVLSFTLSFRTLGQFLKAAYNLSNLKLAFSKGEKNAVKLVSDPAMTFAMAKNSIEGDVLIAAAQSTERVRDFMKYSSFGKVLGGKLPIITAFSLTLSLLSGFASSAFFDSALQGLYSASAIQLFSALPFVFLLDVLPLYRTSKKLKPFGAAILGKVGIERCELANAVVLNSYDLFPEGTVTLHQMKVLNENNLDDTFIKAAALTEYMGSTLAPIFKSIIKSGNIDVLPDTDTVKYEDRMGISGWVDNCLLFIGNRTLMEAHGIEVPSFEFDLKILRGGFFPVYVATRDKACAVLMIQYSVSPKVAKELRKLTNIGVTVLVNNSDPNLTEEMICDYLGLYSDSVKVMTAAGCHMYKTSVTPTDSFSAPAVFKGSSFALAPILNCANKIKRTSALLTASYIVMAVLGTVIFAYTSFIGNSSLPQSATVLLCSLVSVVISYLVYLAQRP